MKKTLEQAQGERFKALAEDKDKFDSLKDAAAAMGMQVTSLYRYFRGEQAIGKNLKEKIFEVFGEEDYEYILTGRRSDADTFSSKKFIGSAT